MTQSHVARETPQPFASVSSRIPPHIEVLAKDFRASLKRIIGAHEPSPQYGLSGSIEILDKLSPEWRKVHADFRNLVTTRQKPLCEWPDHRRNAFLTRLLRASWTIQTCSALHRGSWSATLPERGQSAVTALLINAILGGSIRQYANEGYGLYFSNILPGDRELDLTREQFPGNIQLHPKREPLQPEKLLNGEERDYSRAAEVAARYQVLLQNFTSAAIAMALACASLPPRPSVPPAEDLSASS